MGGRREGGALRSDSSESCGEARIAKKPDQGAGQVPQTTNKQTDRVTSVHCRRASGQLAPHSTALKNWHSLSGGRGVCCGGRTRSGSAAAARLQCPAASQPRWRQQAWWWLPLCGRRQGGVLWPLRSHLLLRRFSHGTRADSTVSCFTCRPARPPPGPVPQSLGSPARQAWWEQVLQ